MDRKHKVGQRIVAGLAGTQVDDTFRNLVRESAVGNVILFRRNIESSAQLTRLCAEIRAVILEEIGVPPLITIDQEGGVVARLTGDMPHTPGGPGGGLRKGHRGRGGSALRQALPRPWGHGGGCPPGAALCGQDPGGTGSL